MKVIFLFFNNYFFVDINIKIQTAKAEYDL